MSSRGVLLGLVCALPAAAQINPSVRDALRQGQVTRALKILDADLVKGGSPEQLAAIQLERARCLNVIQQPDKAEAAVVAALQQKPDAAFDDDNPELMALWERARRRVTASLTVTSEANARVRIDDKEEGGAPLTVQLPVGKHRVEVLASDGRKFERELLLYFGRANELVVALPPAVSRAEPKAAPQVEPNASGDVRPRVEPPNAPPAQAAERVEPARSRALPVALLTGGLVLAGAGGACVGYAQSKKAAIERGEVPRRDAEIIVGVNAAGIGGIAVGGALLVTSIVLFATTGQSSGPVALTVHPDGAAVTWSGQW